MTRITIDVPDVPYPGDRSTATFFRTAARNLRGKDSPGGSNVRGTVALLLERTAHALDGEDIADFGRDPMRFAPDGRSVVEELTYAERQALPPVYHQPVWYDLCTPKLWACAVCWDEGEMSGWPCKAAERDGGPIAEYAGLDRTY